MQKFQLDGQPVRFFQLEETTYLVTVDANKAFGFDGKNTSIDESMKRLSRLLMCRSMKLSYLIQVTV
jgi:L-ribulose-5-phosphate 3-epimerase UlaE